MDRYSAIEIVRWALAKSGHSGEVAWNSVSLMFALPPKAVIKLNLEKRAANDATRMFAFIRWVA
jgi:hypothetical protein